MIFLKAVAFVSRFEPEGEGARVEFGATAFIVSVPTGEGFELTHVVTAKHVVDAIEPAEAVIGINAKDDKQFFIRTGDNRWFYHPTEPDSVDVAVMPFGGKRWDEYDIQSIPENMFATDERIATFNIGVGDEITVVGLFTRFTGITKITPLVRTGNIAMMPKDKIPTAFGEIEAYLAEGRSIGGLSGSPVFARNTVTMGGSDKQGIPIRFFGLGSFHLLGLTHGHWDLPVSFPDSQRAEAVNMGVSIIVPAKKILETLYHQTLIALRKEYCEKIKREPKPTMDSNFKSVELA